MRIKSTGDSWACLKVPGYSRYVVRFKGPLQVWILETPRKRSMEHDMDIRFIRGTSGIAVAVT